MTHTFDGFNHIIRLEKGEYLMSCLEQFVQETGRDGAWIEGIGTCLEVTLGFFDIEKKAYEWKTYNEPLEIGSLSGNLAMGEDGKYVFHLHGTFAGRDNRAIAGHVKDLAASVTVELFIHRTYKPLHRFHDETWGIQLLALDKK